MGKQNDQRLSSTDRFSQNKDLQICRLKIIYHYAETQKARTNCAGYILRVLTGWQMSSGFEQCLGLNPVLFHHPWHSTAMGSILLLPTFLTSQACYLEQELCHLAFLFAKHLSQWGSASNLSPWYYCNPNMK